jgi:Tol biopolymer transport system component
LAKFDLQAYEPSPGAFLRRGQRVGAALWIVAIFAASTALTVNAATLGSVSNSGVQGNAASQAPWLSANGRWLVFRSKATNLAGPVAAGGRWNIFERDLVNGTTELCSINALGGPANGDSFAPQVSADGRYVVFQSKANNLVASDTNGHVDIFLRDTVLGETALVSRSKIGGPADGDSKAPSISQDGAWVAYETFATNVVPNLTTHHENVVEVNISTAATQLISVTPAGAEGNGNSYFPSMSADGRYVAFTSAGSNLVVDDVNIRTDVFRRDVVGQTTTLLSRSSNGVVGNRASELPSISADGNRIAFRSSASNLVPGDSNGASDDFVRDVRLGTTTLVSMSSSGVQGNSGSWVSTISPDGNWVVFTSDASNLATNTIAGVRNIFVAAVGGGSTFVISTAFDGSAANGGSSGPAIANGVAAFASVATNVISPDANGSANDVYVATAAP